jgi:hypothetical protein
VKLKITQKGFEGFTGYMGTTEFAGGISVSDVSKMDAERIGAALGVEWVESGKNPSVSQAIVDNHADKAVIVDPMPRATEVEQPEQPASAETGDKVVVESEKTIHTRESLETIADQQGIAGLREIGDGFGVKARSVKELIDEIMNAQK